MNSSEDKSLLLKWLNGTLTPKEATTVEGLPNMDLLAKAIDVVDTFEMPKPDLDKIEKGIDQKRQHAQPFVRRYLWPLSAVAAIITAVAFWFIFASDLNSNSYQTTSGEQMALVLPDQSTVQLNAVSSISYNEKDWPDNRRLSLEGSAYFKVEKGSDFTVETPLGNVQVLGTQFEVLSRRRIFEVLCFEGKIRLHAANFDTTIVAGQGFISQLNEQDLFNIETNQPAWVKGTLHFRQKRLAFVFEELERQYSVSIHFSGIHKTELFTGTVPLDNLELSLNIICTAMGLKYNISSNGSVAITK